MISLKTISVLLVEDEPADAHLIRSFLSSAGKLNFQTVWVETLAEARSYLEASIPEVVLLDLNLPDSYGLDTVQGIREVSAQTAIVVLTGHDDEEFALQTLEKGAQDYLVKGEIDENGLGRAIRYSIQRKVMEEELAQAKEAAEAASKAKSRFLANMSHEIRTPLSGIMGALEMLSSRAEEPKQQQLVQRTLDAAGSMQKIIDDILDLSKVEAGKLPIYQQDFDPHALVHRMISLYSIQAVGKQIELQVHAGADVPEFLHSDPYRLEQVLRNLVSNAIKFTSEGVVAVSYNVQEQTDNEVLMRFEVSDTGPGIPLELQQYLFESFTQADDSYGKKYQGTGLGLAISRQLVQLMGGELDVQSTPDRGSTFYFTLPCKKAQKVHQNQEDHRQLPEAELKSLRVLVAEDVPLNQEYIQFILSQYGHSVDLAATGVEAVRLYEQGRHDLILMDIQMPEMDGLEAAQKIRRMEKARGRSESLNASMPESLDSKVPIIALTAYAMPQERDSFLQAGMDGYVSKPIDPQKLFGEIKRVVRGSAAERTQGCKMVEEESCSGFFDMQEVQKRFGQDQGLWKKLLQEFVQEDVPEYLQDLEDQVCGEKLEEAEQTAHKLKGALGTLCASSSAEKASLLHQSAREGDRHLAWKYHQDLLKDLEMMRDSLSSLLQEVGD